MSATLHVFFPSIYESKKEICEYTIWYRGISQATKFDAGYCLSISRASMLYVAQTFSLDMFRMNK